VDGYNQLINMLQEQSRTAISAIQENLKRQQQELLKVNDKKNGLLKQVTSLMPDLGNQVYRYRPVSDMLSVPYAKVDGISNEIREVNDQINLTQARLASVNSRSVQRVAITGGALVLSLVCIIAFASVVVPFVSKALKPDPKRDIRLVQSWTLENCSSYGSSDNYLDISVWENRRNDAVANVDISIKLLGSDEIVLDSKTSELEIAPNGVAVSIIGLDPKGSRVQNVTRSIGSTLFNEVSSAELRNVTVETFFEKTKNSDNVSLSIEITNGSDFALEPVDVPYAFVINEKDEVVDIQIGNLDFSVMAVDSLSTFAFQSINYFDTTSCLKSDYSQDAVTFWYFVPVSFANNSDDRFTISGKIEYSP
jgi:hypothetical protein